MKRQIAPKAKRPRSATATSDATKAEISKAPCIPHMLGFHASPTAPVQWFTDGAAPEWFTRSARSN